MQTPPQQVSHSQVPHLSRDLHLLASRLTKGLHPVVQHPYLTDLETQAIQLNEQMHSLKLALEGVEKERDFYFGKLREIELLCQEHGQENDDLVQRLMEVLYAPDEQESQTEEPEAEEQACDQQPQQQEED